MNYYEARQRKDSGLWDWTVMNDGNVHKARPCIDDDCKHATREEAERHHWQWSIGNAERYDDLSNKRKCEAVGCEEWTNTRVRVESRVHVLCPKHVICIDSVHPFVPGLQIASSW